VTGVTLPRVTVTIASARCNGFFPVLRRSTTAGDTTAGDLIADEPGTINR
jgi:hypothetical protein